MYETVSGSLQTIVRNDLGSTSTRNVRYPDDVYDRMWSPSNDEESFRLLSTSSRIDSSEYNLQPPSKVMSTAITTYTETDDGLDLSWKPNNSTDEHYLYMHFSEIEANKSIRQFNISLNDHVIYPDLTPHYLELTTIYTPPLKPRASYKVSLNRTGNSTLPPMINAIEVYRVKQINTSQTYDLDVEAILNIKSTYGIKRNWQGDPCGPKADIWIGLICNSDPPRIISLNFSSSELAGKIISPYIANLTKLESLDLSNNALIGDVPQVLSQLTFLRVLNLKGNNFTGQLPSELLAKSKDGSLLLSVDGPGRASNSSQVDKKHKKLSAVALASVGASVVVLGLLALLLLVWIIRRKKQGKTETERRNKINVIDLDLKNRQFTYSEILHITNNLEKILGKGGFGTVYHGYIDDCEVAVKMLSQSSAQGLEEFQAEASLLMSIHHKNLISVVGYCVEGTNIGIIYEYMDNGSLDSHLSDRNPNPLTWAERLQIMLDAAQGLEYLHHSCRPPIIHRDVKPSNILLDDNFNAKLADFGLSRTLPTPAATHLTTDVKGTPGYLDPEYYRTNWLTEKSDVYSFGIVLLEIITGRTAAVGLRDSIHVIAWVNGMLKRGEAANVIDPRLPANEVYESSAREVVELAMRCVSIDSTRRPVMSVVVSKLKECLSGMSMTPFEQS